MTHPSKKFASVAGKKEKRIVNITPEEMRAAEDYFWSKPWRKGQRPPRSEGFLYGKKSGQRKKDDEEEKH